MPDKKLPSCFYSGEAMQHTCFRSPAYHPPGLTASPQTPSRSMGCLLDRMSLSVKNAWCGGTGRVCTRYTADEICSSLNCIVFFFPAAGQMASPTLSGFDFFQQYGAYQHSRNEDNEHRPQVVPRKITFRHKCVSPCCGK